MKKIVLWVMSTLTALVLLFGYHTSTSSKAASGGGSSAIAPIGGGTAASDGAGSGTAAPSTGTAAPSTSASTGSTTGAGTVRTVTGTSADTRYGPVQVRITVLDQKVTHVSVVQYPQETFRDREINSEALPILIRETLDAQSAHVDMVSGATYTSEGYLTSLQSALDRAGL